MAGVYKGLNIKFGGDTTDLDQALGKISSKGNKLARELKQVEKALKLDPKNTDLLKLKFEGLGKQVANAEEKLKALKNAESQIGKGGMSTEQWDKLQRDIALTESSLKTYKNQLKEASAQYAVANSALGKMGDGIERFGKAIAPAGEKLQSLGAKMTATLTTAAITAGTASVKLATDFETSLAKVSTLMDENVMSMEEMGDGARELATQYGVSASGINEALYQAMSASVDTAHALEFVGEATRLSKAGFTDQATAVDTLTTAINAYGMSADDAAHISDVLVNTQNLGKTTVNELGASMGQVIPTAAAYGVSLENLSSAYAIMTKQGINTANATTAINGMLNELADSGSDVAEILQNETGKTFGQLMADGQSLGDVLSLLYDHVEGNSEAFANLWKNLRAQKGALAIAKGGADEFNATLGSMVNAAGVVDVALEKLGGTTQSQMNKMKAEIEDASITVGQALLPVVSDVVGVVKGAAAAFNELDESEQQNVIRTAALVAGLGPALTLLGTLMVNVRRVGSGMMSFATLLAKVDMALGGTRTAITQVADASGKMVTKIRPASVAMGALKASAAAAAVAGVALLVSAIKDYVEKQRQFESATKGLGRAIDALDAPIQAAGSGTDGLGASAESTAGKLRDYSRAAEDAAKKGAELAERMGETFSGAQSDAALAQHYADVINELAGNCGGSTEKLYRLKEAIGKYNEITGSSYAVTDEFSGRINAQTGELDANTEAFKRNVYAKAASSMAEESAKHEIELEMDLAGVRDQLSSKTDELTRVNEKLADGSARSASEIEALSQQADQLARDMDGLKKNEESLTAQRDAAKEATDRLLGKQAEYAQQADEEAARASELAASTAGYAQALEQAGEGSDAFANLAQGLGVEVDDLAGAMGSAGVKTEELASIGSESFATLYANANGNIKGIMGALDIANAFDLDPKTLTINEDGTFTTVEGHIIDLNESTIDGKHFEVSDGGTIKIATDDVEYLQNFRLGDKEFHVTAIDDASATIDDVIRKASLLNGATMTVSLALARNAAGGISLRPIEVVGHAAGGIATHPILTNTGIIGEDGAEAVLGNQLIPLTNRRYVRPFAQAVAAEMSSANTTTNVTNVYIGDVQALPDTAIYDAVCNVANLVYDEMRA